MIYSPRCPVFRNDAGELLSNPYRVDFFTCPAPNAGAIRTNQPESLDDILPTFRERINLLLALALKLEVFNLVLGAWGCGVFQNDPVQIAKAFYDLLAPGKLFFGRFATIRFSVLDRAIEPRIFNAFLNQFDNKN
jgi:uncharacterized protein (TIGR02452 family)